MGPGVDMPLVVNCPKATKVQEDPGNDLSELAYIHIPRHEQSTNHTSLKIVLDVK